MAPSTPLPIGLAHQSQKEAEGGVSTTPMLKWDGKEEHVLKATEKKSPHILALSLYTTHRHPAGTTWTQVYLQTSSAILCDTGQIFLPFPPLALILRSPDSCPKRLPGSRAGVLPTLLLFLARGNTGQDIWAQPTSLPTLRAALILEYQTARDGHSSKRPLRTFRGLMSVLQKNWSAEPTSSKWGWIYHLLPKTFGEFPEILYIKGSTQRLTQSKWPSKADCHSHHCTHSCLCLQRYQLEDKAKLIFGTWWMLFSWISLVTSITFWTKIIRQLYFNASVHNHRHLYGTVTVA